MNILAIRGATTVNNNSKDEILNESSKMIETIVKENNLHTSDIISMCFTMTNDLDEVYPSVAVRELLNVSDVPMLNFEEKFIKGSLRKCIRVMMYINTTKDKNELKHIYLNKASVLRPDLI